MSTASMVRAVQDHVLAERHAATTVAVYGALVTALAELCGEADASCVDFRDDAVLQAAMNEADESTRAHMGDWIGQHWQWIRDAGEVLDALDEVPDMLPAIPAGALAYRTATVELVLAADGSLPAAVWAGAEAQKRWLRLYGGIAVTDVELCAADPVVTASFRALTPDQRRNIAAWVRDHWEQIDDRASAAEAAS